MGRILNHPLKWGMLKDAVLFFIILNFYRKYCSEQHFTWDHDPFIHAFIHPAFNQSNRTVIHPSNHPLIHPLHHLPIHPHAHPKIRPPMHLPIHHRSIHKIEHHLSIHLTTHQSTNTLMHPPTHSSIRLSTHLQFINLYRRYIQNYCSRMSENNSLDVLSSSL